MYNDFIPKQNHLNISCIRAFHVKSHIVTESDVSVLIWFCYFDAL